MIDKEIIIRTFIKNFVLKEKQARVWLALTNINRRNDFVDKLNHSWNKVLDVRKLKNLPNISDDYGYVKKELQISDTESSYVISNFGDIDDQFLGFRKAFEESYKRGLGSLIIISSAEKIYLETEEIGHQNKFIGKING